MRLILIALFLTAFLVVGASAGMKASEGPAHRVARSQKVKAQPAAMGRKKRGAHEKSVKVRRSLEEILFAQ
uniref:Uncharacterized protein n=1 Tax=Ditylenchus dipsaci TaxID=166011 RepID=A0A915DT35_9BILA